MEPYAVVETGGKQYRISAGDTIEVEYLDVEIGAEVDSIPVLAVSDGKELKVGTPAVEEARIVFAVADQKRGPKVVNFKKKRRKSYTRKVGHRQERTVLQVKSIA